MRKFFTFLFLLSLPLLVYSQTKYVYGEKIDNYWYHWNPSGNLSNDQVQNGWSALVFFPRAPQDGQTFKDSGWYDDISQGLVGNIVNIEGKGKYYFAPKGDIKITAQNGKVYTITPGNATSTGMGGQTYAVFPNSNNRYVFSRDGKSFQWAEFQLENVMSENALVYSNEGDIEAGVFNNSILYAVDENGYATPIIRLTQEKDANNWQKAGSLELIQYLPVGSHYYDFDDGRAQENTVLYDVLNAVSSCENGEYSLANINRQLRAWVGYVKDDGNNTAQYVKQGKYDDENVATFLVSWHRPINVDFMEINVNENEMIETLYLIDYLRLYDWRGDKPRSGYMYDDNYWFWAYYNVKEIDIDLDPSHVMTNLHQNGSWIALSKVTTNIQLCGVKVENQNTAQARVVPGSASLQEYKFDLLAIGGRKFNYYHENVALKAYMGINPEIPTHKARFGGIYYKNNGDNVQSFSVKVPVVVKYEWGSVSTTVRINFGEASGVETERPNQINDNIPARDVTYNGDDVSMQFTWSDLSNYLLGMGGETGGMTLSAFAEMYQPDHVAGSGSEEDGYKLNIFNFGNDIYGNEGTPPATGYADPENPPLGTAKYYSNGSGLTGSTIVWTIAKEDIERLIKDKQSPITVTRWICFAAKTTAAPYPYLWVKLSIKISWSDVSEPEEFTSSKGLTYTVIADGQVSVRAANTELSGEVSIPEVARNTKTQKSYTVTAIADEAFKDCASMISLTIPKSVTTIGNQAFTGCTALTAFDVLTGSASYTVVDGVLYNYYQTALVAYPAGKGGDYELPSSVTSILDGAFANARLSSITVSKTSPSAIAVDDAFDDFDFDNCILYVPTGTASAYRSHAVWGKFNNIIGGETVTYDGATYRVTDDGNVTYSGPGSSEVVGDYEIPATIVVGGEEFPVTAIAPRAFADQKGLVSVTIPETVKTIGEGAFSGCENLEEVHCRSGEPIDLGLFLARTRTGGQVSPFEGINFDICILYVPVGSKDAYQAAPGWSQFKHIIEYDYTGISNIFTEGKAVDIYTTGGTLIRRQATSLESIPTGVYIINGRKIYIKN